MDEQILIASESGKDFLAHYGVKGQQWGNRRYQNEDGSLTEEGRRHYGLKSAYSNMSDEELRNALAYKRKQNEYVGLMTAKTRKKTQDISEFVKAASGTAKTGVQLTSKTYGEYRKDEWKDLAIDKANKAKNETDPQKKAELLEQSKLATQAGKNIESNFKGAEKLAETPGTYSNQIAKIATKDELQKESAAAYKAAQELDKDQLEKVVNRMLLEKQYDELVNPPQPSKWEKGREYIQTLGAFLGVALTAASIYQIFKGRGGDKAKQSDLDDGTEYLIHYSNAGEDFLAHYRTKGSKNGVRRYQNEDGSLTPEGYRHYGIDPNGRQAADPRELLARQRAQQQMQRERFKAQTKQQTYVQRTQAKEAARQNAYTQKIQARAALREAKTQARMQAIFDRQNLATQRQAQKQELEAKAENRANIRKNIIKGVAATAAIAGAIGIGYHFLHNRSLDLAHGREMEKMTLEGKNKINEIFAKGKVDVNKIGAQSKADIAKISKQGDIELKKAALTTKPTSNTVKEPAKPLVSKQSEQPKQNMVEKPNTEAPKPAEKPVEKSNTEASKPAEKPKVEAPSKQERQQQELERLQTETDYSRRMIEYDTKALNDLGQMPTVEEAEARYNEAAARLKQRSNNGTTRSWIDEQALLNRKKEVEAARERAKQISDLEERIAVESKKIEKYDRKYAKLFKLFSKLKHVDWSGDHVIS